MAEETNEEQNKEPDPMLPAEYQSTMKKGVGGIQPPLGSLGDKPTDDQVAMRKVEEENRQLKTQQVVDAMLRSVEAGLPEATEYQKQQIGMEVVKVVDTIVKGKQMPSLEGVIAAVQKGVLTTQEKEAEDEGGQELTIEKRSTARKESSENNSGYYPTGTTPPDAVRDRIRSLTGQ